MYCQCVPLASWLYWDPCGSVAGWSVMLVDAVLVLVFVFVFVLFVFVCSRRTRATLPEASSKMKVSRLALEQTAAQHCTLHAHERPTGRRRIQGERGRAGAHGFGRPRPNGSVLGD